MQGSQVTSLETMHVQPSPQLQSGHLHNSLGQGGMVRFGKDKYAKANVVPEPPRLAETSIGPAANNAVSISAANNACTLTASASRESVE
jgi:hypothetical protein